VRASTLAGIGIAHFLARRLDEAAAGLLVSMELAPTYVTPYYYLAALYAHLGRHDEARETIRKLAAFTTPAADPLVIKPQPPEHRGFFLEGYRMAMSGPNTTAETGAAGHRGAQ
jgi:hypothetical protein